MRRIFYLITELDAGGAEKALFELARGLDRTRFEARVGCLTGRGPIGQWLERESIPVEYFDMTSWANVAAWGRLRSSLKAWRPHVLHSFLFHANFAARVASVGLHIDRRISSVRVEEPRRLHLWLDRLTQRWADKVTCVSESAVQYTHLRAHIPLEKLVAIPNGVDPAQCDARVLAVPPEWNVPEDAPVIGVIGRLDRQKDPLNMLRVVRLVSEKMPEAVFIFAGHGPLENACKREAARLRIENNVGWIGWVPDVRPLLSRMSMLALSSRWEGMPNVVLEAMACRKPVVATRVGGTAELVEHDRTGLLAEHGQWEIFAGNILRLISDRPLREAFGCAARERIENYFSIDAMIRRNEALYA